MATVLIVDDSASMRQMVAVTLKDAGHSVTVAENGRVALDLANTQKFDLVLTDVNMPVMDGITLTREIRKLSLYRFTPILILTTEAGGDKKQDGKAAGATGWLVKPFNPTQLLATISRVIA